MEADPTSETVRSFRNLRAYTKLKKLWFWFQYNIVEVYKWKFKSCFCLIYR